MPQRVEAIIFDCDGVLVDTEQLKFEAWRKALAEHGIEFTLDDYMPMVGHSGRAILQMIDQLKQVALPPTVITDKESCYRQLQARGVVPLSEAVAYAQRLAARGQLKLGLASSAPREEILVNLKQIGLDQAFDLVISGADDLSAYSDPTGVNKPKPYIYLEAARRLSVDPAACVVYEDTAAGVDAAATAGMFAIAIPNRFTAGHNFSRAAAIIDQAHLAKLPGPQAGLRRE